MIRHRPKCDTGKTLKKLASGRPRCRNFNNILPMTGDGNFLWGRSIPVSMPRPGLEAIGRLFQWEQRNILAVCQTTATVLGVLACENLNSKPDRHLSRLLLQRSVVFTNVLNLDSDERHIFRS